MKWEDTKVLITGATGSFGKNLVRKLLDKYHPAVIRIFSRDELKQYEMRGNGYDHKSLRYFIGDIRDYSRLKLAVRDVDVIIHAAALKQVPSCEYNPFEAIKTNIIGSQNVIRAALENNVQKILALSTDKSVNPVNLYGATKLCAEKLFINANSYVGDRDIRLSCVRYGNVLASRGSVIQLFEKQKESGTVTVTDRRMTRFWLTLEQSVEFVIDSIEKMKGGEVFIPKVPSMKIIDLAKTIVPDCSVKEVGIRPGEKIHEILVTKDESRFGREYQDHFLIEPSHPAYEKNWRDGKDMPDGFEYRSDKNDTWLTGPELLELLKNPSAPRKIKS